MATNNICGVSILRAGETMEQAVCDVCKDIRIGKILIQTNLQTGEPEVRILINKLSYRNESLSMRVLCHVIPSIYSSPIFDFPATSFQRRVY